MSGPLLAALRVAPEDVSSADARQLMSELSAALVRLTGDPGLSSFAPEDLLEARACFVVARDASGRALGCGALRPLEGAAAELKRMFARPDGPGGVGSAVLADLEQRAVALGYREIRLSTRQVNARALDFYRRHGFQPCAPWGRYAGREASVCLSKSLAPVG